MKDIPLKKEIGKFLAFFIILYLIVFIVLNVTGWLIRPPKMSPLPENSVLPSDNTEQPKCVFSERIDSISIPKIGIEAPLVFPESQDNEILTEALNSGVVYYPLSAEPGQDGQTILLGHSAPAGWPKIRYDWVFSDLNKLETNDEVYVFYRNCQYNFKVSAKLFLERGEEIPENDPELGPTLLLISCWPPGKDIRRIAVQAILDQPIDSDN